MYDKLDAGAMSSCRLLFVIISNSLKQIMFYIMTFNVAYQWSTWDDIIKF